MISIELRQTIERVLEENLKDIGYVGADIVEDIDQDGDPILEIDVNYRKVGAWVDPTPTFGLSVAVRDALRAIGENRFPHLKHFFPDDQDLKVA